MNTSVARGLVPAVLGLALAGKAPAARAQDFTAALTPVAAPLANGATQNHASSVYYDVTNAKANTNVTQVEFRLPAGYTAQGGLPPAGWALSRIASGGSWRVQFRTVGCTLPGASIVNGQTVTFRVDVTPPGTGISGDTTDYLNSVRPANPCGANGNWTRQASNTIPLPRKVLWVTASAAPLSGASPLADTLTVTVKNESTASKTGVTVPAPTVTASSGATYLASACSAVTSPLAAGATSSVTCPYTLTAAPSSVSTFGFAATATGPTATALGASAGPVVVGPATATFAYDNLAAGPGDGVEATLAVRNNTGGPMTITPPTFAQLTLQNVAKSAGATDPAPATVGPGGTAQFVYALTITGVVSSRYQASGTAGTTSGNANLAATPPGAVAGSRVDWLPSGIVKSRAGGVYQFTIAVVNNSAVNVSEIDVINPQPTTWTGIANVSATGISYKSKTTTGGVDTLVYTGALPPRGTATIAVRFSSIPDVTSFTGSVDYNFQVKVILANSGSNGTVYYQTVTDTWPIDDVANLSILSAASGQTLYWTNTTRLDTPHDGVVVFRTAAPAVPPSPADGTDYTVTAGALYSDKDGSTVATLGDPSVGAYNYRVCNHDDNFVYSSCNSGFWNNAGWIDSVVAPTGGWSHALGGQMLIFPGLIPGGRVGVASNTPNVNVLEGATGQKPFPAMSLPALPSRGTPVAPLGNGRQVLFAADQSGNVTAADVQAGAIYWQVALSGQAFAGVSGALRQYASVAFQAAYPNDVLFVGSSTTGTLYALDATTGATLWTVAVGSNIRAQTLYDAGRNWIYVPNEGGIRAYDLAGSGPGAPPAAAAGWANPGGIHRIACTRADLATQLTCVDTSGNVRVLDRATGAVAAAFASTVTSPSSLWFVPGGVVVGNASRVSALTRSGATFALAGSYAPGLTLSPVLVFTGSGSIYVSASDRRIHKLSLSSAAEVGSVAVASQAPAVNLGPPAFDVVNNVFVFGSSDGHLWAVPFF